LLRTITSTGRTPTHLVTDEASLSFVWVQSLRGEAHARSYEAAPGSPPEPRARWLLPDAESPVEVYRCRRQWLKLVASRHASQDLTGNRRCTATRARGSLAQVHTDGAEALRVPEVPTAWLPAG
jgi:hypothetical protein